MGRREGRGRKGGGKREGIISLMVDGRLKTLAALLKLPTMRVLGLPKNFIHDCTIFLTGEGGQWSSQLGISILPAAVWGTSLGGSHGQFRATEYKYG